MRDLLALWGLRDGHGDAMRHDGFFSRHSSEPPTLSETAPEQCSPRRFERAAKKQPGEAQSLRNAVALSIH